MVTRT